MKQNTILLQVNSTNFPSKSPLTLLSALDREIWRERESERERERERERENLKLT